MHKCEIPKSTHPITQARHCYLEIVEIMLHQILQIIAKVDLELILEPVGLSLGDVTDGVGFEY